MASIGAGAQMSEQRFTAILKSVGQRVWVELPFDPDAVWGQKDRHHVRGLIANYEIRGPLTHEAGRYVLALGAAWRRGNGLAGGDEVNVILAPEGPQLDRLAGDIVLALEAEPEARAFFEGLATYYRKNYLRWVDGAKRPETRRTRIAEMVALLKVGRKEK